jgi:hypothetical protein
MMRHLTFLAVIILSFFLCAMTPLTESDMSSASNPFSLNINIDKMKGINNGSKTWDDSGVISKFNLRWNVYLYLDDSNREAIETQETSKDFSDPLLCWGQGWFDNLKSYLRDLFSNPFALMNDYTKINAQVVNAEDINNVTYRWILTGDNPSIPYAYPFNQTRSSNTPYSYIIMSGNTEMRDTYINNTSTTIPAGSYTNIRTH